MADPRERDLFNRSLSGDWNSRVRFFKKFIWTSSDVRQLGAAYRQIDDFLYDCFANVLRSGHSFEKDQDLREWVESVAAWTALERRRYLNRDTPAAGGRIRMCAAVEGDESDNRSRLASYVPPRSGPDDSLATRLASLAGEPQFTLLRTRGVEKKTWEEAAAAAGRPLNTVGPLTVRCLDRLSRFFGAPPPLNDDLASVFAAVANQQAQSGNASSKPTGRRISIGLDPGFYSATPELRKIGLSVPAEVRMILLWDVALSSTPPRDSLRAHLAECTYCSDLLRALMSMQRALESAPSVQFLLCPGGFTLVRESNGQFPALDQHLAECPHCSEERATLFADLEPSQTPAHEARASAGKKIAVAAIAVLILAVMAYFVGRHYSSPAISSPIIAASDPPPPPQVETNPRYSDLAQKILITDSRWLDSVALQNRRIFIHAVDEIQSNQLAEAKIDAASFADHDPGGQMLYAFVLYMRNSTSEGYAAMGKAEAMPPRNAFRCWAMLQCALIVGDLTVASRETDHLSSDPQYAQRAKDLLLRAKARH